MARKRNIDISYRYSLHLLENGSETCSHDPTLPIPAAHTCQTAGSTAVLEVARLTELMCRFAFGEQIPIDPH